MYTLSHFLRLVTIAAGLAITACASTPKPSTPISEQVDANQLFTEAKTELNAGKYKSATALYEKYTARFPYGIRTQQAFLDMAWAYYKQDEPAQALSICDRYIKQYPNTPSLDYVYYLKGLITFNDNTGIFSKLKGDPGLHDPESRQESYNAFREVTTRWPNSAYAEDAIIRMRYLLDQMARSEIAAARYYATRSAWLAAINRAKYVLEHYPSTPSTEDALGIMVDGYRALAIPELATDAHRVLVQNFPQSRFLNIPR